MAAKDIVHRCSLTCQDKLLQSLKAGLGAGFPGHLFSAGHDLLSGLDGMVRSGEGLGVDCAPLNGFSAEIDILQAIDKLLNDMVEV